jgi:hypothetical protein
MSTEKSAQPYPDISQTASELADGSHAGRIDADPAELKRWRRWASLALLVAALACLFGMLNFVVTNPEGVLDFVGFYTTGEIVRQGQARHLYDVNLQQSIEREFLPQGKFFPLDHPPFESWLCLPFAFFPYRLAYLLWAGFNLLLLALGFCLLPRTGYRLDGDSRLAWLATCLPLAAGVLVLGQDSLLLVPIFLLTFLVLKKRRDLFAGLILGAGLFRFEIMLPFMFVFLLRRRWKVLAGFSIAVVVAVLASLPLVGWGGLLTYGKILLEVGKTTGSEANGVNVANMPSLRGALAAFSNGAIPHTFIFPSVLVGTLLLLVWTAREFRGIAEPERPEFDLQFSFAVIAALLASYHIFSHELTPLIVVAYIVLGYEHVSRRNQRLLDRPGAELLLLFALTMIVGAVMGFRNFSVLFVVLVGMLVWLWQEMADPETAPLH